MNEWSVVMVVIALVGFILTVMTPILKATKAIVALTTEIKYLIAQVAELKNDNLNFKKEASEKHGKIHKRIDEHDEKLADHEKRIYAVEHRT